MRFIKIFFGVVLCICALGFAAAIAQVDPSMRPFFIVLVVLCVLGAVLLFKKPKHQKTQPPQTTVVQGDFATITTEYIPSEVPADTAREMRKYYTLMQAQRDMDIMADSYRLASTTTNLDTFCMRYDLAMQKAYTLLQAEQVGVRGIKKLNCHNACQSIIQAAGSLKVRALHDYAQEEIIKAEELKTQKGKLGRYVKMLATLEKAEPTFMLMPEYEALLERIKDHIARLESTV